jgi:hypothetical protein
MAAARDAAALAAHQCDQDSVPYVFLDADSAPNSFDASMAARGDERFITVFRNDAAVDGSRIAVLGPSEVRARFTHTDSGPLEASQGNSNPVPDRAGAAPISEPVPGRDGTPIVQRLVAWLVQQDEVLSITTIDDHRAVVDMVEQEVRIEIEPKEAIQ